MAFVAPASDRGGFKAPAGDRPSTGPPLERTQLPQDQRSQGDPAQGIPSATPAQNTGKFVRPPTDMPLERTELAQEARSPLRQAQDRSFRQGSAQDIQFVKPPYDPRELLHKIPGYTTVSESLKPLAPVGRAFSKYIGEPYEKYIHGPYRRTMFKTDPLETIAERAPAYDAPTGEKVKHLAGTVGTTLATDPLLVLGGAYSFARSTARLSTGVPKTAVEAPVQSVAPRSSAIESPRPAQPTVPPIQDLAQQHQAQVLGAAREAQPPSPKPTLPQREVRIGQQPTGSLERTLEPLEQVEYRSGGLAELPTGSLLRVPKTRETASIPLEEHYPRVPTERKPPVEITDFESKVMHGQEPLPLKPFLKSAEDLLQDHLAKRELQYKGISEKIQAQHASEPLPESPPELLRVMLQPDQMGPRGDKLGAELFQEKGVPHTRTPSALRRVFQHAYDTLDDVGPLGRRLSDILRYTFDYSESGTRQNFLDYLALVRSIWPERSRVQEIANTFRQMSEGDWKNALNRSALDFGISKAERDALVELHERGSSLLGPDGRIQPAKIQEAVTPRAWETLRSELLDPRVHRLMEEGWLVFSGRASSHPAVQSKAKILDPITGHSTAVGPPTPFWPHQPVRNEVKRILAEQNMKRVYNERGYADKMTYEQFAQIYADWVKADDPATVLRKYAGIENKRLLDLHADAKAHGRTVAESARYYGYEDDPLRALLKYNLYALKRAAYLEHGEELVAIRQQLRKELGEGSTGHNFVEKVVRLSQGISEREDMLYRSTDAWGIVAGVLYPAFLKRAWSQNFLLQPNFVQMQTGMAPIIKAVWQRYGKILGMNDKELAEAAERSGATFPAFMARYHLPEGAAQQYNKTANILNTFSVSDAVTRRWAGEIGIPAAEALIRKWWRDPANPKWQRALEEGNLNPNELYTRMSAAPRSTWEKGGMPPIPSAALQRYAQTLANRSMGRTTIRSLPAWMASDTQAHKVFMMLHRQLSSNEGVFWRNISNAPTIAIGIQRALRHTAGAAVAGTLYQGLINWVMGNGFFDVNEPLAKAFKDQKMAAFFVKSIAMGYGTITAGILLSGLNALAGNYGGMTYGILTPPAAALIDEVFNKAAQGKFDEVFMRLQPSEVADVVYRRHKKEERQRRSAPSPGRLQGLGIGLSQ